MGKLKKYKFVLVGGEHKEPDENGVMRTYTRKRGENIITTERKLDQIYKGKFKRYTGDDDDEGGKVEDTTPAPEIPIPENKNAAKALKIARAKVKVEAEKKKKNDVTKDFPDAAKLDLIVVKEKDGLLNVYDPEIPDKPLNPKPVNKAGVSSLLKKYTG